jgi:hypothetical protein
VIGTVSLLTGAWAKVVLVGDRRRPKGAMLVMASPKGAAEAKPLAECVDLLPPRTVVEILCAQERTFGMTRLRPLQQS